MLCIFSIAIPLYPWAKTFEGFICTTAQLKYIEKQVLSSTLDGQETVDKPTQATYYPQPRHKHVRLGRYSK